MSQPLNLVDPMGLVPPCTNDPNDGIACTTVQVNGTPECDPGQPWNARVGCDLWFWGSGLPGNLGLSDALKSFVFPTTNAGDGRQCRSEHERSEKV